MRTREPSRHGWRFIAALILVVLASVLLMQEALARALGSWLAGVWVSVMDVLLRILGAPLGAAAFLLF